MLTVTNSPPPPWCTCDRRCGESMYCWRWERGGPWYNEELGRPGSMYRWRFTVLHRSTGQYDQTSRQKNLPNWNWAGDWFTFLCIVTKLITLPVAGLNFCLRFCLVWHSGGHFGSCSTPYRQFLMLQCRYTVQQMLLVLWTATHQMPVSSSKYMGVVAFRLIAFRLISFRLIAPPS